ncbi:MAG: sigma 54-interacting transcriptional regulator [Desulfonatronovibrio sp.]
MAEIHESKLKVLYELSKIVGDALELEQSLERILGVLAESLCMNQAALTLIDDESGRLAIRASYGLLPMEKIRGVCLLSEGTAGRVLATGKPFIVQDIFREPLFLDKIEVRGMEKGKISFMGVPVVLKGEPVGVLVVDRILDLHVPLKEDIKFLSIVAAMVAQFVSLNRQVKVREGDLRRENLNLKTKLSKKIQKFFMAGKSSAMAMIHQMIEKVAPTRATVLLLGEPGIGKSLIARNIHELSERSKYPFIKVNCASLRDNLLESELFGYEEKAFYRAMGSMPGRFEEADKGTIFLDEIGEMPIAIQAKLLRFLQERNFERPGGTRTISADVRVIAATSKNLPREVHHGRFCDELFCRLNVFPVKVPPLRERRQDIPILLNCLVDKIVRKYGRNMYFNRDCLEILVNYSWPGNIREMENLIEQLCITAEGDRISSRDLPLSIFDKPLACTQYLVDSKTLEDMEKKEVIGALERNAWVQSRAARDLGISQRQIGYKVSKFDLRELIQQKKQMVQRS